MTKKQIKNKSKVWIWTLLVLAPVLVWILSNHQGTGLTITEILTQIGVSENQVTNTLNQIFGSSGMNMINDNSFLILYGSYILNVVLLRIIINVLSFIPLVIGNLLSKWSRADEENLL